MRQNVSIRWFIGFVLCLSLANQHGAESPPVPLPPPKLTGGKPLMEALQQRQTVREFKTNSLPQQVIANLLWAGFGINRPGTGHRTAPSAMNSQEIEVYVLMAKGVYFYDSKSQGLQPLMAEDLRSRTSGQAFGTNAPLTLVYVADFSKLTKAEADNRRFYAAFDAGCICQNVYLFCASSGLGTVVHDLDRAPLASALKLRPEQQIIMAQAVGYPK
jgi:nitroreductase